MFIDQLDPLLRHPPLVLSPEQRHREERHTSVRAPRRRGQPLRLRIPAAVFWPCRALCVPSTTSFSSSDFLFAEWWAVATAIATLCCSWRN